MHTLAQVEDGKAAWAEFFEGVTQTFESNEAAVPVVVGVVVLITVMIANIHLARWLAQKSDRSRRTSASSEAK